MSNKAPVSDGGYVLKQAPAMTTEHAPPEVSVWFETCNFLPFMFLVLTAPHTVVCVHVMFHLRLHIHAVKRHSYIMKKSMFEHRVESVSPY